ncbi:MAG: sulfite exporter TauE/SafE family protein [Bacteroidales bacterium]|nr:sulfite exporter TauE/SafE family protein [Bacteroidales bacterium]
MSIVLALFVLSIVGAFVQRTTGFGFGIFMMTMLPALMPTYGEATALSGLLSMSMSVVIAYRMRRFIVWRRMWGILIAFTITSTIAIYLLAGIDDSVLQIVLGITLIVISLYFCLFSRRIKLSQNFATQTGAGFVSGLMGGFFGMHGAPAALYFVSSEPSKEHYMAMCQAYFTVGNVLMSLVRWHAGYFTPTVMEDYLYGIGGVVVGTVIGRYVYKFISVRVLRYIVYFYIGISGLIILLT